MPKKLTEKEKLAAQMAKVLGKSVNEVLSDMLPEKLEIEEKLPSTLEERLMEAQSVVNFFYHRSEFKIIKCKICKQEFAYKYHYNGITMCSIECMRECLREIGLDWTIDRPLELRWGPYAPAVVPAVAYSLIQGLPVPEESISESENIQSTPHPQDDFLADLDQLLSVQVDLL